MTKKPKKKPLSIAQQLKRQFKDSKIIGPFGIFLLIIVIAVVAGGIAMTSKKAPEPADTQRFRNGEVVTVEGEYVCLPHKDTTGPQTDECALGLKTDDDHYFGLQILSGGYSAITGLQTGDRLEVTGTFQKRDSIYQSTGVIISDTIRPAED